MFKKIALGCGIALLITGIAAAVLTYYVYRQVSSTITQFAALAEAPELERSVKNRDPYVPPASEELDDGQLEKLMNVQAGVRQRLGDRMQAFEAKYKTLVDKTDASIADAPMLLQAYSDLANTWLDAKRAQVEALNAQGLSLEEYRWIREQSYRALGLPFVDMDLSRLLEDAKNGVQSGVGELRGALGPAGPEANRARVAKVKKLLEENLALASFGL